jgi:hypothetical protein
MVLVSLVMPLHTCTKQWSSLLIAFESQISEQRIFDQLPVMGDGFFGDGCTAPLQHSLISTTGPVYCSWISLREIEVAGA